MEYTYGSGTVWVIGSGIFGDKLIRANKLYKSELVEIKTPAGIKNFEIKDVKYI